MICVVAHVASKLSAMSDNITRRPRRVGIRAAPPSDKSHVASTIAVAAFVEHLGGGLLALGLRDKLHLILGFSAGAVIGVAFFDLLPEAVNSARVSRARARSCRAPRSAFCSICVLDRILLFHGDARRAASVGARRAVLPQFARRRRHRPRVSSLARRRHRRRDRRAHSRFLRRHQYHEHRASRTAAIGRGRLRWLLADAVAPVAGIAATPLVRAAGRPLRASRSRYSRGFFLYIGASDLIPESYHAHPKFLTTVDDPGGRRGPLPRRSPRRLSLVAPVGRGGAAGSLIALPADAIMMLRDRRPLDDRQALVQKTQPGERAERRLARSSARRRCASASA